jgi:hypothetical protein
MRFGSPEQTGEASFARPAFVGIQAVCQNPAATVKVMAAFVSRSQRAAPRQVCESRVFVSGDHEATSTLDYRQTRIDTGRKAIQGGVVATAGRKKYARINGGALAGSCKVEEQKMGVKVEWRM